MDFQYYRVCVQLAINTHCNIVFRSFTDVIVAADLIISLLHFLLRKKFTVMSYECKLIIVSKLNNDAVFQ